MEVRKQVTKGDMNTYGPEVEVDGRNTGTSPVINLAAGSDNSVINNLVINHASASAIPSNSGQIYISSVGNIISNDYIGMDVKGILGKSNYSFFGDTGIYVNGTSSLNVIDNNLISGIGTGITVYNASHVTIKRNIIGLSADQHTSLSAYTGIKYSIPNTSTKTDLTIGGDSPE